MFMDLRPEAIQKMMLTPKMLLSMHMLQLNIMDLRVFMRAELEENPLLEEEVSDVLPDEDEAKLDREFSQLIDENVNEQGVYVAEEDGAFGVDDEKRSFLESLITKRESLYEHLHWQLEVLADDDEQKRIGEFLIGNLDDNGYLKISLKEAQDELLANFKDVKNALSFIRSLDPVGVGSRDLRESLLIQLIHAGKGNSNLYRIVYFYLEDLEKGNYEKIANVLSITVKEVELAKKRLSYLNPKPGANFSKDTATRIIPDVFLNRNNGSYNVEVNEYDLPRISINRRYVNILRNKKTDELTKRYIKDKLLRSRWFIDAIKQRENTIMRVCEYLVNAQKDFLDNGEPAAKPLTLKEVAEKLFISEATVSRTVSNKYIQAPTRIFAMKQFFVRGIRQESGTVASVKIKQKIKELIENEDTKRPLKDKDIQMLLKKERINISRRTIAKYRDSLMIPPFNMRKR